MIKTLHQWLALRLAVVWLVLSLASGLLVHYLGHAQLYAHITNMAKTEAAVYKAEFMAYAQSPSDQAVLELLRQRTTDALEKDNFVAVTLYDNNLRRIAEAAKTSSPHLKEQLARAAGTSILPIDIAGKKLEVQGETYITVSFPLEIDKQSSGRLDGIYHAPREILAGIRHQTYVSIGLVVMTILLTTIVLYPIIIRLNSQLVQYSHTLAMTNIGMLKVLGSAVAKRDSDTNIHNYRVSLYSVRLGERLGISRVEMQGLIKGAFLHDVGKIAISDRILLKPGKLTDEEFAIMKTHVRHGEDIIAGYAWLADAGDVVRCHHEKFDGSGYPNRAAGDAIPHNARIFAVADVFDAVTSRRAYKEPLGFNDAVAVIRQLQGSQFDPAIVALFLEQAAQLYEEIYIEDEAVLRRKLEESIGRYFDQ